MSVVCVEKKSPNKHLSDGLRILARIIAREAANGRLMKTDRVKSNSSSADGMTSVTDKYMNRVDEQ